MLKKSLLVLALAPFLSQAAQKDENPDLTGSVLSGPNISTEIMEQYEGVKIGSGFIDTDNKNNSIIIGNTADDKEIPVENPNKLIAKDKPRPPVAKSDSDIAIGNSAYANSEENGQQGAPAIAFGNAAVATGEGSVAFGSKAVSNGLGGIAIGDAAKQNNGGISIGSNADSGIGGDGFFGDTKLNRSVAIGTDAKVINEAKDSIALGANSVAGKMSTDKALFLKDGDRAGVNIGELSVGQKSADLNSEPDTYRRITHVAGGAEDTDVANIAQLKAVDKTATEANTKANTALTTANEAKKSATTALTTANEAKTTAGNALTTANKAQTSANHAQNTATDAKTIANTANNTANNANYTANIANKTANNAWNLANHNSDRIDKLENRINDFDDKMKRGFAMSAATSNLFQPYSVGKFNVSAAIGGYNSENAIAVGSGYRFNENIAAKASVSTSTSNSGDLMYGAGVNFEW